MAGKNKLRRFAEMGTFSNVFEPPLQTAFDISVSKTIKHPLAGHWTEIFGNDKPIILELGCGKGEYTVGMARRFPEKNFIGVDIKGARIWVGARQALSECLDNARFIRTRIDFIDAYFALGEVAEIWITFPDPQLERPRKRLTAPLFIERYRNILSPDGCLHLKTDSNLMFDYTAAQIQEHDYQLLRYYQNLYSVADTVEPVELREVLAIPTHYERLFSEKGHTIHYLQFSFNAPR